MKRINQRQAIEAIRNKEAFKAGALSARWEDSNNAYIVESYIMPIAAYRFGRWAFDEGRYSKTTSRHQSIVRQAIGEAEPTHAGGCA